MTDQEIKLIQELIEGAVAKAVPEAVEPAIKKYVNGKIDNLTEQINEHNEKHEADMEEIKPWIQASAGFKVIGKGVAWLLGLVLSYLTIKSLILPK